MSDPKRFDHLSDGLWQNSAGDYVLYSDYVRLKAEVDRLKAELADEKSANANVEGRLNSANRGLSMRNHLLQAEVERLRASSFVTAVPVEQYERLREAGDRLASALILFEMKSEEERLERIKAWSSAKKNSQP